LPIPYVGKAVEQLEHCCVVVGWKVVWPFRKTLWSFLRNLTTQSREVAQWQGVCLLYAKPWF
jgi:hypothetical protein